MKCEHGKDVKIVLHYATQPNENLHTLWCIETLWYCAMIYLEGCDICVKNTKIEVRMDKSYE